MWSVQLAPGMLSYEMRGKRFLKGQSYMVANAEEARVLAANSAFVVREVKIEREKAVVREQPPAPAQVAKPEPKPVVKPEPIPEPETAPAPEPKASMKETGHKTAKSKKR